MKEAVGGTYLFQITIIFLLVFTGVMCITINRSKAFGVKDEIIDIIQNRKFAATNKDVNNESIELSNDTIGEITDYINNAGYRITGKCPDGYKGFSRDGSTTSGSNASFCIRTVEVSKSYVDHLGKKCNGECDYVNGDMPNMIYYDIVLFYQIDAPILDDVFNFTLKGSTKMMYS